MNIDRTDVAILDALAENSRVTASELVSTINLSIPSINKRIAKLKESGLINRFTITTRPEYLGTPLISFIMLFIDDFENDEKFRKSIKTNRRVLECYSVSGEYDYLIKICSKSMSDLEATLSALKKEFGVTKSFTMFCMNEIIPNRPALPDEV